MKKLVLENNLPNGWALTKLDNICELIGGGTPSRQNPEYFDGDILWLTPTEIPKNKIIKIKDSREKITEMGLKKSSAKIIPKNSVLLTSRASIGYVAIADTDVTTNQGFASFVCSNVIYNLFLAYWLFGKKDLLESKATGTTFKEISKSKLKELEFKLPPLNEQKKIVEKIEELFSKLHYTEKLLEKSKYLLNQYQHSLLKSIFEDKLFEFEPKKITLSEIFENMHGMFLPKNKMKKGNIPVFGGNGILGYHNDKNFEGEIIIVGRVGAQCGNLHHFSGMLWITDNTIGLIPKIKINSKFFLYQLKNIKLNELSAGSGQPYISGKILSELSIVTTDIKNQNKIVFKIEQDLLFIKNTENIINSLSSKLKTLYSTLLKQAFEGKLISQDPNDEPSKITLHKIKQEKELLLQKQKVSRKKKNVK